MMGQLAEMRGYRPARWRDIDAAQAEREITPDPHMNPFAGMPQETNRIARAQHAPDTAIDALRWGSLSDAATGLAAGSTVARALPHPLARAAAIAVPMMGSLMDPAEGADPRKVISATSAFDVNKPNPSAYHRISGRKLDRPLSSIPVEYTGRMPYKSTQVDPASLEGNFFMPLPGDPTMRGRTIHSVDEIPLSTPLTTKGGRTYINDLEGFANMPGAATTAAGRVKQYQDKYDTDVIGAYLKMGPQSADFSHHTWGLLARMFPQAPMTGAGIEKLNTNIKNALAALPRTEKMIDEGKTWTPFTSVKSARLEPFLERQPDVYRKEVINEIFKARGKIPGVPDVVAARYAATDPALLDAPAGSSGLSMTKLTGATRPSEHPDYKSHLVGKGSFGFGQQLPAPVMWHDLVQEFDKRGKTPDRWGRVLTQTPLTGVPYGQLATPQWVDRTSGYMADVAKMGETAAFDKYMKQLGWRD